MALLSIKESAKRLGIPIRTLYGWVEKDYIKTEKLPNGRSGIEESELERLQAQLSKMQQSATSPDAQSELEQLKEAFVLMQLEMDDLRKLATDQGRQIADQEKTITQLDRALESLKQEVLILMAEPLTPQPSREYTPQTKKTSEHSTAKTETTRQNLPPGTITDAQLAAELGMNKRTLRDNVANPANELEDTPIFKRMRGDVAEHEHYFTPDQADRVRAWYKMKKHQ